MSVRAYYLTESERAEVAEALYHEGLGYLHRREFVGNIAHIVGSPGEEPTVVEIITAVLDGAYRGWEAKCPRPDCRCRQ